MNRIFVYEAFEADNYYCKECGYMTVHTIKFKEYILRTHEVKFLYFCSECYETQKEKTLGLLIKVSVVDWLNLINSPRPDN